MLRKNSASSLVELLMILASIAFLSCLLLFAVHRVRAIAERLQTSEPKVAARR